MRTQVDSTEGKDASLTVEVVNDELVIRVGIGTLAWAFEHQEDNNPYSDETNDFRQEGRVTDTLEFAKDVRNELQREEEDGTTPLHLLFDKACTAAVEQGCLGIEECTDNKSAYTRDYEKAGDHE